MCARAAYTPGGAFWVRTEAEPGVEPGPSGAGRSCLPPELGGAFIGREGVKANVPALSAVTGHPLGHSVSVSRECGDVPLGVNLRM